MGIFKTSIPMCSGNQHCSKWFRVYMNFCLCNTKDGVSLGLGIISVISWGVAEIPQIMTNYREKSTEGLSVAFLMTWILGDLFNLIGCKLEPATLPTQFYMAVMYTVTTMVLAAQTLHYRHIYDRLKCHRKQASVLNQTAGPDGVRQQKDGDSNSASNNQFDTGRVNVSSTPISFPAFPQESSPGRELYYTSARSLSKSYTPPAGTFLTRRMSPLSYHAQNCMHEPLLTGLSSTQSAPPSNVKAMLCLVPLMTFLGTFNLYRSSDKKVHSSYGNTNQGIVIPVGRKLLQVTSKLLPKNDNERGSEIGPILGWAMAAIYMGGRVPQICLNIRRGNAQGLNPLMFFFALVGNGTYVASILVKSLDWSKIRPNLPWLVDAGGCVLLDSFILIQFIYFHYWGLSDRGNKKHPLSTTV